ncbi:MAG: zinc-ribbon domain-containing protein [Lachnospiraceae bacterium]|nr:zinc-ribbon domain-containing protein [Lachnospiraceae bacterium]
MQCPKCNENIKDGMRFCTKCGHDLNIPVDNQPSVQKVPPVGEPLNIKQFENNDEKVYERPVPPIGSQPNNEVPVTEANKSIYEKYQNGNKQGQQTVLFSPVNDPMKAPMTGSVKTQINGPAFGPTVNNAIHQGLDGRYYGPDGRVYIMGANGQLVEVKSEPQGKANKNKKGWLTVLIICLSVLFVCGLGLGAYFLFFNENESTLVTEHETSSSPTPVDNGGTQTGGGSANKEETSEPSPSPVSTPEVVNEEPIIINISSYNDDIRTIIGEYLKLHPDFDMEISYNTEYHDTSYYNYIKNELPVSGSDSSADIFVVDLDESYDFVNGQYSDYVLSYDELGIETSQLLNEAGIAKYAVDLGTRHSDRKIVGLGYESTCALLFYNRAFLAKVKGDIGVDPADAWAVAGVFGADKGIFNDFTFERMRKLQKYAKKAKYKVVVDLKSFWEGVNNHSKNPWINQGQLEINDMRQSFLDIAKDFYPYTSKEDEVYFDDKVAAYIGSTRFLRNVLNHNSSYGEWGVCCSPIGYYDGGEMLMINANVDPRKINAIKDIIEWITLDSSDEGFQYKLAAGNSALTDYQYTIVLSEKVDEALAGVAANGFNCIGEMDIMGSRVAIPSMQITNGNVQGPGHKEISNKWYELAIRYAVGEIGKDMVQQQLEDYVNSLGIG